MIDAPVEPCAHAHKHSIAPLFFLFCSSCETKIDKWYTEEFHTDNFQHTTSGSYGPANFQTETVGLVFWCHNKIEQCQIKINSVSIGESANSTVIDVEEVKA